MKPENKKKLREAETRICKPVSYRSRTVVIDKEIATGEKNLSKDPLRYFIKSRTRQTSALIQIIAR